MLYDRAYMRSPRDIFKRSFCDQIILLLITCFLAQAILSLILTPQGVNQKVAFGAVSWENGYIWTPITYALFHDGPLHLIVNLIGIHFIGRPVESLLGTAKFRFFCLASLLFGLLFWLPFNYSHKEMIIGSSSVVLGSLCIFCLFRPNQPISLLLFFILPITVKPKWVLWGTLGLEIYGFLGTEVQGIGGIAHSAHLGGMACGLIFYLSETGLIKMPVRIKFSDSVISANQKFTKTNYKVNFSKNESIREETDRILDKINSKGFGSLTADEKETLEKAKKLLEK